MGRRKINRCQMSGADRRPVSTKGVSGGIAERGGGGGRRTKVELLSGAGSWGCGSTWHGIVDGRVGCLDVALGVIDGGRVGGWEVGRSMHG